MRLKDAAPASSRPHLGTSSNMQRRTSLRRIGKNVRCIYLRIFVYLGDCKCLASLNTGGTYTTMSLSLQSQSGMNAGTRRLEPSA